MAKVLSKIDDALNGMYDGKPFTGSPTELLRAVADVNENLPGVWAYANSEANKIGANKIKKPSKPLTKEQWADSPLRFDKNGRKKADGQYKVNPLAMTTLKNLADNVGVHLFTKISLSQQKSDFKTTQSIDPKSVVSIQPSVNPARIQEYIADPNTKPEKTNPQLREAVQHDRPIIVKSRGYMIVVDGNHRMAAGLLSGKNVDADVFDADAYAATMFKQAKKKAKDEAMDKDIGYYVLAADRAIGPFINADLADRAAVLLSGKLPPAIAFDTSTRSESIDGQLRVEDNHISKACVSGYLGSEIPGCENLGLEPDKLYKLLRDPAELEKAAPTFRGVPLLIEHIPVNADDHPHKEVVGTIGTEVVFSNPYLDAPLVVWTAEGNEAVKKNKQKELSAGYHYRPDMTPGVFEGEAYDGVMRDIVGNHVALVEKGRAGPDVVVGDKALKIIPYKETHIMAKQTAKIAATVKLPSRTALRLGSALAVSLSPMIAQDKQLDLSKVLAGVTAKNFKSKKKEIAKLAKDGLEDMLTPEAAATPNTGAGGAGPDDVIMRVLDMVDSQIAAAPAAELQADVPAPVTLPNAAPPPVVAGDPDDEDESQPKKGKAAIMDALRGKGMSEDDLKEVEGMFEPEAEDEDDKDKDEKEKDLTVDKKAMDEAIAAAQDATAERMRREFRETQEARDLVRPLVGDVAIAHDTAEKVLRAALGSLGVKGADTMHVDALRPVLTNLPAKGRQADPAIAQDSVSTDRLADLAKRFPAAANIRIN